MSKFNNIVAKSGNFVKTNKVPLLYIGGAIVVVTLAVPLVNRLKKMVKGETPSAQRHEELKKLKVNQQELTISSAQAENLSNLIVKASSSFWGTKKSQLRSVFEAINTPSDMALLYKKFGTRPYSIVNAGEASGVLWGIFENIGGYKDLDLIGWISTELDIFDGDLKEFINSKLALIDLSL